MSERAVLIGATGLVGRALMAAAADGSRVNLTAIARRETALPPGARMQMLIAEPGHWPEIIADLAPPVLFCALGTTWAKAGRSEAAFRAVDHDLVLACARAAAEAGTRQMVVVSAIRADARSKNFYLRVKGETEDALRRMPFARLDILRPGLLTGARGADRRRAERIGIALAPVTNRFLRGTLRRFRSIPAREVAAAMLSLAGAKPDARFVHDNDGMRAAILRRRTRDSISRPIGD